MNLDSNISNLLAIQYQISSLKNIIIDNPHSNISNLVYDLSIQLQQHRTTYQSISAQLQTLYTRLFPLQNYLFYSLNSQSIHTPSFISSLISNYAAYNSLRPSSTLITDLNPYYIKPIVQPYNTLSISSSDTSIITIDLSNHFYSVTGSSLNFTLEYGSNIPRNNLQVITRYDQYNNALLSAASIYGRFLTILPDYRDTSYQLYIWGYDYFRSENPLLVSVSETGFPPIITHTKHYSIWLGKYNNNTVSLCLDNTSTNVIDSTYSKDLPHPVFFDNSSYPNGIHYLLLESNISLPDNVITFNGSFYHVPNVIHQLPQITIKPYPIEYGPEISLYPIFDSVTIDVYQAPLFFSTEYNSPTLSNQPYIIDLLRFSNTFIPINSFTSYNVLTTLPNDKRVNRIDHSLGLFSILNDSLYMYPDFRDATYTLTIQLQNPLSLSHSNVVYIHVSEIGAQAPSRTDRYLLLNEVVFDISNESFTLSPFFANPSGGLLQYHHDIRNLTIYSNIPTSYDTLNDYARVQSANNNPLFHDSLFQIIDSTLTITPDLRFISYDLYIYASNVTYNIIDYSQYIFVRVNENRPVVLDPNNVIPNIKNLTDNSDTFLLDRYIYSPVGIPLTYTVTYNTNIRVDRAVPAQIVDSTKLLITGDYRNTTYNVTIHALDPSHPLNPLSFTLSVQEEPAPYPTPLTPSYRIEAPLLKSNYTVDLNTLFTSLPYAVRYVALPTVAAYNIDNSNLILKPNLRGVSQKISIYAINLDYGSFNTKSVIAINYFESYPVMQYGDHSNVVNQSTMIDLTALFKSPTDQSLSFYYEVTQDGKTFDPRPALNTNLPAIQLISSKLYLNLDFRGETYLTTVYAYDSLYPLQYACNVRFNIIEPSPDLVTLRSASIQFNKESVRVGGINSYQLLHNFDTNQLAYYPGYQFSIANRNLIPQSIYIQDNNTVVFTSLPDINALYLPINIDIYKGDRVISANTFSISFLDIPTINVPTLTDKSYSYSYTYLFTSIEPVQDPYNNVAINHNTITVLPQFRGNVGNNTSSIQVGDMMYFGSVTEYKLVFLVDNSIYLYFNVSEKPPFYVSASFYENNNSSVVLSDNNTYVFNQIASYLQSNSSTLKIVFEDNIEQLLTSGEIRKSNYPILSNQYANPFVINKDTGQVTVYPDYRNQSYTITVKAYLEQYPDKYVTANYHITETPIPPIENNSNLIAYNNLIFEKQVIYLKQYYTSYVYNRFLHFNVYDVGMNCNVNNRYSLDYFILTLEPNARGISYDLQIHAIDEKFSNINSNLFIHVEEGRLLNFADNSLYNFDINAYNDNNPGFLSESFSFDISRFFVKTFDLPINGAVTDAYLIDSLNTKVFPKVVPREGVFNQRKQTSTDSYEYLATIKDNIFTIYPDSRNYRYAMDVSFWLSDYPNEEWRLGGSRFIVSESNLYYIDNSFLDLTNIPQNVDLYKIYSASSITSNDYTFINNPYDNIVFNNGIGTLYPNCRGPVGIAAGYVFYNGKYWYGNKAQYDIAMRFNENNFIVDFKISEHAPFYIDVQFPGYFINKTLSSITPFVFNTIHPYLFQIVSDTFVYQDNLSELYSTISDSKYPIDGYYKPPFTVDALGKVTVYPSFRGTSYTIKITTFMSNFPDQSITVNYAITESTIPRIHNNSNIVYVKDLLIDPFVIDLSQYYDTYVFSKYLSYSAVDDKSLGEQCCQINGSNLIITPLARRDQYHINIFALDNAYDNSNHDLFINVVELGFINIKDQIPTHVQAFTSDSTPIILGNTPQKIDISSYYSKAYPTDFLQGTIKNAYIVDSTLNPITPVQKPRDGIFNQKYSNLNFDYLGNIDKDFLTIYPDWRGLSYCIEVTVWLEGYSNADWILPGSTFIVNESSHTIYNENTFSNLVITSASYDLYKEYPVPFEITSHDYDITINPYNNVHVEQNILTVYPNQRGIIGRNSGTVIDIDGFTYYGSNLSYNIQLDFNTNISLNFTISEKPPFYIKQEFYDNNVLSVTLDSNIPYTFPPIIQYVKTFSDLSFKFDCNLTQILYSDGIRLSFYPIEGQIRYPFYVNQDDGSVTVFPDFRNTSYSISVLTYLDGYSDRFIISTFNIYEAAITPIVQNTDIVTFDNLLADAHELNLQTLYPTYPYSKHLTFTLTQTHHTALDGLYNFDGSNLYISPYARGISYQLAITATDTYFNIFNADLKIYITENRYLDFSNHTVPSLLNVDIPDGTKVPIHQDTYTYDLSTLYVKALPDTYIQGQVTNVYLLDNPNLVPRNGHIPQRDSNGSFDYIATISDDLLYIYPDYRGSNYVIDVKVWLEGYSNADWVLTGSSFLVSEPDILTIEHSYSNLTNIEKQINLHDITPVYIDYNLLDYRFSAPTIDGSSVAKMIDSSNLIIIPDSRGTNYDVWVEGYYKADNLAALRMVLNIDELPIPILALSFDLHIQYESVYYKDLNDMIDSTYLDMQYLTFVIHTAASDIPTYIYCKISNGRYLSLIVDQYSRIFTDTITIRCNNTQKNTSVLFDLNFAMSAVETLQSFIPVCFL